MARKRVIWSFSIDSEVLKKFKEICTSRGMSSSRCVERLMIKLIERYGGSNGEES